MEAAPRSRDRAPGSIRFTTSRGPDVVVGVLALLALAGSACRSSDSSVSAHELAAHAVAVPQQAASSVTGDAAASKLTLGAHDDTPRPALVDASGGPVPCPRDAALAAAAPSQDAARNEDSKPRTDVAHDATSSAAVATPSASSTAASNAPTSAPSDDASGVAAAPVAATVVEAAAPAQDASTAAAPDAASSAPAAAPSTVAAGRAFEIDGSLTLRHRARSSGDAHDQDSYAVLSLDAGNAAVDRVSARLLARVTADVDGRGDAESQAVFSSLQDTHGDAVHADVYEASIAVRRPFDAPVGVRLGRQAEFDTPEYVHYDGVRVASDPFGAARWTVGAYGGLPARFYEGVSSDERTFGAWTEARPWKDGRVRADWMRVQQDAFDDDLLALSVWQKLGAHVRVDAGYSRLENEDRDVRVRATYDDGRGDLHVQASAYELLNPLRAFASEFDPFSSVLQTYEPYRQARLLVSKSFGDHLRASVGGDVRRLTDDADEGRLNHDYERGYATLVWSDGIARGLDVSLTGDAWNSDEHDARTWGLDLTWRPDERWRASIGSAYSLYEYDVVSDVERDDVRTWYARVRRTLSAAWSVEIAYEYQDDDFDDYQELTAGATWHF